MSELALLIGGLHIDFDPAAIWDQISGFLAGLMGNDGWSNASGGQIIVAVAIFACCLAVVRCIRTALSR